MNQPSVKECLGLTQRTIDLLKAELSAPVDAPTKTLLATLLRHAVGMLKATETWILENPVKT